MKEQRTYQKRKDYLKSYYREYMKHYRKQNPEKTKRYQENYILRKAEKILKERSDIANNETA